MNTRAGLGSHSGAAHGLRSRHIHVCSFTQNLLELSRGDEPDSLQSPTHGHGSIQAPCDCDLLVGGLSVLSGWCPDGLWSAPGCSTGWFATHEPHTGRLFTAQQSLTPGFNSHGGPEHAVVFTKSQLRDPITHPLHGHT